MCPLPLGYVTKCTFHVLSIPGGLRGNSALISQKDWRSNFVYEVRSTSGKIGGVHMVLRTSYIRSTYALHSTHFNNGRDAVSSSHEKCSVVCSEAGI